MNIKLNGQWRVVPEGSRVSDLPAIMDVEMKGVAFAVDGEVIVRSQWDATPLTDGQQVEMVRAVQGG